MLKRKGGPSLSIEEINRIAADGWAGKRRAGAHAYHLII
jgi:hypothetical protein